MGWEGPLGGTPQASCPFGWTRMPTSVTGRGRCGGDWRSRSSLAEPMLSVRMCGMRVRAGPAQTQIWGSHMDPEVTHSGGGILGALLQQGDSELFHLE